MSRISSIVFKEPTLAGGVEIDRIDTPQEAWQRLKLREDTSWNQVVRLDVSGVGTLAREIDAERASLELAYQRASKASDTLKEIEELLADAEELTDANANPVTSLSDRGKNQNKLNALLDDIDEAIKQSEIPAGTEVFDGTISLGAGAESMNIGRLTMQSLGRISANSRRVSIADLVSGKVLDTRDGSRRDAHAAARSLEAAANSVVTLREKIEAFQRDAIRPRLGDVATAFEGLYDKRAISLGGTNEALAVARDVRGMLLASAALAAGAGAEDWDRDRVLALVT